MKVTEIVRVAYSIPPLLKEVRASDGLASPAQLVQIAMGSRAIRPMQIASEFVELVTLVKGLECRNMLEIGTYRGGTLFAFAQACVENANILSIDYCETLRGRIYQVAQGPLLRKIVRGGQRLTLFREDSHKPEALQKVLRVLGGQKLDFLFIDADHSYAGVKEDFAMYSRLVRSGGIVAFHDIAPSPLAKEVDIFWNEIKCAHQHHEFIHEVGERAMGIGAIFM